MNNVKSWHELFEKGDLKKLESLLDKNIVFYSPIVFKGQVGRKLAVTYLKAAYDMFFADDNDSFQYVRELNSDTDSVLEFTCEIDGIQINGVDMITWTEEGKIKEFKVMIRPLKAIDLVKERMLALLTGMSTIQKLKSKAGTMIDKLRN